MVVQLKGKFYTFTALWRLSTVKQNSEKALQPIAGDGAATEELQSFIPRTWLNLTFIGLQLSVAVEYVHTQLSCFDWCC